MPVLSNQVIDIYDYQVNPEYNQNKLTELEDRSRCNNVGLDGFTQVNENTCYKFEEQVQEVFSKKVRSENSKIERADRTKRNKDNKQ